MAVDRRLYLLGGLVAAAGCGLLPVGPARDLFYLLVGASAVVAIVVGVRRHRPAQPLAWYLMAASTASWVLGDAMYSWFAYRGETPFPSGADAVYLAGYPLFAAGLFLLVRSEARERWPTAVLDSAILSVALGLLSWVLLIEPTWALNGTPPLERLIGVAYPIGDGLLFAILLRLAIGASASRRGPALRLLAGSVVALVVADVLFEISTFVPAIGARLADVDPIWLAAYVLWGAAALHPSMRALSDPATEHTVDAEASPLVAFAAALLIGPVILLCELLVGARPHIGAVVCAAVLMVPLILVRMARLVTVLRDRTRRLGVLADTDYVTGLANKRRFADELAVRLTAGGGRSAGLFVDLQRFNEIDETLGHRTGDAILRALGERLTELVGPRGFVARTGEDSFAILDCSISSSESALEAADQVRVGLEQPLELPSLSVSVQVCVGTVLLKDDATEPAQVLRCADVALSAAKLLPGRTAGYRIELETGGRGPSPLIGELRGALARGEIVLFYQPQVEVRTGKVLGVEALARWQHPQHGLLGPDSFIAAAERTGVIGPLTQYVLDAALRQCAAWQRAGLMLTVAVNLSVRNLLDPGLVDDVRAALARHGIEARYLELEITESTAMVDPRRSQDVLGTLADMGVLLSIDDYGTGHSSLAYLQRLPVRRLKIDRSFVTGLVTDGASAAIVHSTIELARHLGLDVVAEGVEDDATLLQLHAMGCFAAQGFGLGRPVPAVLLPALVLRIEERVAGVLGSIGRNDVAVRQ